MNKIVTATGEYFHSMPRPERARPLNSLMKRNSTVLIDIFAQLGLRKHHFPF